MNSKKISFVGFQDDFLLTMSKSHMTIKKSYDFFTVICFFPTVSEVLDTVEKKHTSEKVI